MASFSQFAVYPPFPAEIRTASLSKISLAKLFANDAEESKAMFNACRKAGFFILNLNDNQTGKALIRDIDAIFNIAKQTMSLPKKEKSKFDIVPPKRYLG
jgi:isopenicillin N synthase-like dioxygenase